jgi:hypothetical protein
MSGMAMTFPWCLYTCGHLCVHMCAVVSDLCLTLTALEYLILMCEDLLLPSCT